jgi:phosphatidylglycerophosphate synthase
MPAFGGPEGTVTEAPELRRPLATRQARWAHQLAAWVAGTGVSPNQISVLSLFFAAGSGAALLGAPQFNPSQRGLLFFLAAAGIQLRLLCNMLDGMVAVECAQRSKTGEVFNDLPDRLADSMILVCLGYAVGTLPHAVELGWLAGLLATMTAYVRLLGGTCGAGQSFMGPMAKQHRMALTTAALLGAAALGPWGLAERLLYGALVVLCVGTLLTVVRRTRRVLKVLEER